MQLNLWGLGLTDISVLSGCRELTVLSLPTNKVNTLADVACCTKLQELYVSTSVLTRPARMDGKPAHEQLLARLRVDGSLVAATTVPHKDLCPFATPVAVHSATAN